jgi:hypothetical protein
MRKLLPKVIYAVSLFLGICSISRAQIVLSRQVTATSGASGTIQNVQFYYTIGEPIVTLLTNGKQLLAQGFQQPEIAPKLPPGMNPVKSYVIFPNPAVTTTKLQFELLTNASVGIELYNTAGQVIYRQQSEMALGRNTLLIPVNHLAAGIYTLMFNVNGYITFEKLIVQ